MILSFNAVLKEVILLLNKNYETKLTFTILNDSQDTNGYIAKFESPKAKSFTLSWHYTTFSTNLYDISNAGYSQEFDKECGASKTPVPEQKVKLRIAYQIFLNYKQNFYLPF